MKCSQPKKSTEGEEEKEEPYYAAVTESLSFLFTNLSHDSGFCSATLRECKKQNPSVAPDAETDAILGQLGAIHGQI